MGDLFGGGSAKKAAKEQAAATKAAARLAAISANSQAEAAANQMKQAGELQSARAAAEDLLDTPMESATVDLSVQDDNADDGDLLKRRRPVRSTYRSSGAGLVT